MIHFKRKVSKFIWQAVYQWHPLTYEIDPRVNKRWVVRRSMVVNTGHYCYFRIPKCATSTIVRSLAYHDPEMTLDSTDSTGKKQKKQTARLLSAQALTVSGFTKKYFLFTFVRNPYSRVLSAYLDKIARSGGKFAAKKHAVMVFSDSGRDLTFKAFVSYLENGGLYKNPHWAPQTSMLPVSVKKLDFVGRVENLDKDLEVVVNRLFGEGVYKGPMTREARRTGSSHKLLQYYDKELARRVYALYKPDFDSFSYPKELPVNP